MHSARPGCSMLQHGDRDGDRRDARRGPKANERAAQPGRDPKSAGGRAVRGAQMRAQEAGVRMLTAKSERDSGGAIGGSICRH